MSGLDWEEFERRGEERRQRRDFPPRADLLTYLIAIVLFGLIVMWVVWGLTA